MSNIEYQPAETMTVQLGRPDSGTPWGFRLQGGTDFSTPLSVQVVQPNSVAEHCGLLAGDAILRINAENTDNLTHENAKMEIVRSGNKIDMLVARGAVKIWKPQVTPLSSLRPAELKPIVSATGEEFVPVQKTSLVMNKPESEPCRIGSTHNRAAKPFGAAAAGSTKSATPNVVHSQYNTPIGLYSAGNIASTYSSQTAGIQREMEKLDVSESDVGSRMTGTYQPVTKDQPGQESARYQETEEGQEPEYKGYTNPHVQSRTFKALQDNLEQQGEMPQSGAGFRSVKAPTALPASQKKPQQPSMRCGGCDMLATGVIVKANGVPYHVGCFKCAACGMNLKQKGYFVVEEKLYCETHARQRAQAPGPDMVSVPVYR
ncbi:PDZ and LIM domain protein 3-like isoform X1 [Haliotis cracherodii]|uniref:PDZ and LIM domain protein 3-like isoform X1 n=1 Tax=Haliotis cracherodii TaxID=6455 RepID=UPI0039E8FBF1